ncbi:MAG: hypothetical protein IPQ12_03640 [Polaromonas sp.]|nr:hypothetical protein [Polaromonas sp.]
MGNCAVDIKALVVSINASGYSISPDPTAARVQRCWGSPSRPDGTAVKVRIGRSCGDTTPTPTPIACPTDVVVAATSTARGVSVAFFAVELTGCVKDVPLALPEQGGAASYTSTNLYQLHGLTTLQFAVIASGTYVAPVRQF